MFLLRRSLAGVGRAIAAALLLSSAATAIALTSSNSANGQTLPTNSCASCDALAAQRAQIKNRAPIAGTLNFDKSRCFRGCATDTPKGDE